MRPSLFSVWGEEDFLPACREQKNRASPWARPFIDSFPLEKCRIPSFIPSPRASAAALHSIPSPLGGRCHAVTDEGREGKGAARQKQNPRAIRRNLVTVTNTRRKRRVFCRKSMQKCVEFRKKFAALFHEWRKNYTNITKISQLRSKFFASAIDIARFSCYTVTG